MVMVGVRPKKQKLLKASCKMACVFIKSTSQMDGGSFQVIFSFVKSISLLSRPGEKNVWTLNKSLGITMLFFLSLGN